MPFLSLSGELDKSERAMILKIFASLTGEIGKAYKSN